MATANEIRRWQIGVTIPKQEADRQRGELFFPEPRQPSDRPGTNYRRCAVEQRVIVETEIAAQLAELGQTLILIKNAIAVCSIIVTCHGAAWLIVLLSQ